MEEVEKGDVEGYILRRFIDIDTKRPKAYSQATQWALTLAELNQDEEAWKKVMQEKLDVFRGLDVYTLEEIAQQRRSNDYVQLRFGEDEQEKIRVWQLYSHLDNYYTKILRIISIMYQEGKFDESYMMKDFNKQDIQIPEQRDYREITKD
ncbi:MAG: hypothetical protein ACOCTT_01340 [archaeon]